MTKLISRKRQITAIFLAWLIFIGVDFLFHASLFASFWKEDIPALKPLDDLAILIPAGYLSFFLLTLLVGFAFFMIFKTKPLLRSVFQFGFVFALLFSLSNFFGLLSYIDLPLKQLAVFNFVYFLEILTVSFILYYVSFAERLKKALRNSVLIFLGLIIVGGILQNMSMFS